MQAPCSKKNKSKMELEEYIGHLQGFGESLNGRAIPDVIVPAAEQLYARIKSRTAGLKDSGNAPGYYDVHVAKKLLFSPKNGGQKPVGTKQAANAEGEAAKLQIEVQQKNVLLVLTAKTRNKSKYYATAEELNAYTNDVETKSEELSYKILKGE
jgi:hypothetical protein